MEHKICHVSSSCSDSTAVFRSALGVSINGQWYPNYWADLPRLLLAQGNCKERLHRAHDWRANRALLKKTCGPLIGALRFNCSKTKQSCLKTRKFAILTQTLVYMKVEMYLFQPHRNFVQKVLFGINKKGTKWSFLKLTPPGLQSLDSKWRW